MPTYQYQCTDCGSALEVRQSFSDDALTICPGCEGRLRKVFNAVGVVFKGSGFYRTDSRATSNGTGGTGGTGGSKAETKTETKTETMSDSPAGSKSAGETKSGGTETRSGGKAEATGGKSTAKPSTSAA